MNAPGLNNTYETLLSEISTTHNTTYHRHVRNHRRRLRTTVNAPVVLRTERARRRLVGEHRIVAIPRDAQIRERTARRAADAERDGSDSGEELHEGAVHDWWRDGVQAVCGVKERSLSSATQT